MHIKALLLDLDDTLLINDMETFALYYLEALLAKVRGICSSQRFVESLEAATRAMWHNNGRKGTNAEVFRAEFFPRIGRSPEELMPLFDEFYIRDFEGLRQYTEADPAARRLVTVAFARGYQVAIATQPLFPKAAILARLRWAGVGAEVFPYDYIASYETMSACKPHPRYFSALMEHLGRAPGECLMVGDSLDADMAAGKLGLRTYWVDRARTDPPEKAVADAQGSLSDLATCLETGRIDELFK